MSAELLETYVTEAAPNHRQLCLVQLGGIALRTMGEGVESAVAQKERPLPSVRQFAIFEAFTRNCRDAPAVAKLLGSRFAIAPQDINSACAVVMDYYGARNFLQATVSAIEQRDVVLSIRPPVAERPPALFSDIVDQLAAGLSPAEVVATTATNLREIDKACWVTRRFYDNAVNLSTVMRRSYEWGHRRISDMPSDFMGIYAGISLPFRKTETRLRDGDRAIDLLRDHARGLTHKASGIKRGFSEGNQQDCAKRIFRDLGAASMSEAITRAALLGIDLGWSYKGRPARGLTHRELQVGSGMVLGLSEAEIGIQLRIGENTVRTYRRRLFKKIYARSRAQAVYRLLDMRFFVPVPQPADRALVRPGVLLASPPLSM